MPSVRDKFLFKGHRESSEQDIVELHEMMMAEYGWIPLEQFRNLPIPTLLNLVNAMKKRKEAEAKAMNKGRGKH